MNEITLAATFLCCIATSFSRFGLGSGTENDDYDISLIERFHWYKPFNVGTII